MVTQRAKEMEYEARMNGDRGFCSIVAFGVLTNRSYAAAERYMRSKGRRKGRGLRRYEIKHIFRDFGMVLRRINTDVECPKAKTALTLGIEAKKIFPTSKLLVFYSGHVGAFVNGINHDWTSGRRNRIQEVYEVTFS
jgi:hypothetical protein